MYNPLIELKFSYPHKESHVRVCDISRIDLEGSIFLKGYEFKNVTNLKEIADRVNEIEYINSYVLNNKATAN